MDIFIGVLAAVIGYLIGSVSFTRIVLAIRAPDSKVENIQENIPGSDETFTSSSTGASAVMHQLGPKWGGFTMLLDMLKAVIPALVFRLLFPNAYFYMINALFVMVGHNYPVYYGFKGGRGLSAMMGGFFVFDSIGVITTAVLGVLVGILSGQVVLIRWTGMILMILWTLIFHKGWQPPIYVLLSNVIFWFAMRGELARFLELRKENMITDQKIVAEFMGMGSMYRLIERFAIPNILKRTKKKK